MLCSGLSLFTANDPRLRISKALTYTLVMHAQVKFQLPCRVSSWLHVLKPKAITVPLKM